MVFLLIRQFSCSGEEIKASNGPYLLPRTMEYFLYRLLYKLFFFLSLVYYVYYCMRQLYTNHTQYTFNLLIAML